MILMDGSTFSLPGTDKRTCDMLEGCTALLGELYTQKAQSYPLIPREGKFNPFQNSDVDGEQKGGAKADFVELLIKSNNKEAT